MSKPTAKQIAQSLGVSTAAVSLALNGKPGLGDETRERILAACQEAGFALPATPLVHTGKQKTLCFMIYMEDGLRVWENSPFYAYTMQGVEAAASHHGYNMLIRYLQADSILSPQNLAFLQTLDVLVLLGTDVTEPVVPDLVTMLDAIPQVTTVVLDTMLLSPWVDCVGTDHFKGAQQGVSHLVAQGCQKIAYLCANSRISNFVEREAGVMAALKQAGLPLFETIQCNVCAEIAYQELLTWFQEGHPLPDGIFAENDMLAASALRAMEECGIAVPEQVSVVGFDNLPVGEQTEPPLTTIRTYKEDLGATAVEMAMHRLWMEGYCKGRPSGTIQVRLSTQLIERGSVRNTLA